MAYIVIAVVLLEPRCALILRCTAIGCLDRLKVVICNDLLEELLKSARKTPLIKMAIMDGIATMRNCRKAAIHLPCCHVAKLRRGPMAAMHPQAA